MKVAIDARMYGLKHAGIGRYVENLVRELSKDKSLELVLFARKENRDQLAMQQFSNLTIIEADIPHYSLVEQLLMPGIIKKARVDLVHFPHFNVPLFYFGKYMVTIHDLIKHTSRGVETTTRSRWFYWLKYLGYKIVFGQAVKRATKIIVPSQAVKDELVKTYNLPGDKIVVTYEGVDNKFKYQISNIKNTNQNLKILEKYKIKKPFVIYTGSVYPHKNVEKLIQSIKLLITNYKLPITLVISCARSVFYERFNEKIEQMEAGDCVKMVGFVPDEDLTVLYQEAEAFVFPTLSEGFGLPGLEAMACGLPVVCSDIPVLREIYVEAAVYFDPLNVNDIAEKIKKVTRDTSTRNTLIQKGFEQVKKYSWEKMAQETMAVYKRVAS